MASRLDGSGYNGTNAESYTVPTVKDVFRNPSPSLHFEIMLSPTNLGLLCRSTRTTLDGFL